MTPIELSHPVYHNEEAARAHLEATRWPNGPVCPHCGVTDQNRPLKGESMGAGWYYCEACKDKFTVRVETIYERSHIPLHKWLLAFRLMAASKKGISAHQLHRTLNITYKSAWFLCHRIRAAMDDTTTAGPLGGEGKTVEADEAFLGPSPKAAPGSTVGQARQGRHKIMGLVERGGKSRMIKMTRFNAKNVKTTLHKHIDLKSTLNTDQAGHYRRAGYWFEDHQSVNHHRGEYARGETTTNTIEGVFSIFKRGMIGTYQHCGEQHLQRYLAEFDFRYNNRVALGVDDAERTSRAIKGAEGKRLTYRNPNEPSKA